MYLFIFLKFVQVLSVSIYVRYNIFLQPNRRKFPLNFSPCPRNRYKILFRLKSPGDWFLRFFKMYATTWTRITTRAALIYMKYFVSDISFFFLTRARLIRVKYAAVYLNYDCNYRRLQPILFSYVLRKSRNVRMFEAI